MTAEPSAVDILRAVDIDKRFPGVRALHQVRLSVRAGEIHALVGENGAGKSTLIRILTGAEQPDSGYVELHGQRLSHHSPDGSRRLGISVIYQQPTLFPTLSIVENLALGQEPARLWRRLDHRARRARARELLERIGAGGLDLEQPAESLSMAAQQRVAIAAALGAEAKLLILDEPTACLPVQDAARLHELLRQLRAEGVGLIYITHRLEELPGLADRVTVLRGGETVTTLDIAAAEPATLIRHMVGRDIEYATRTRSTTTDEIALEVRDLGCREAGLQDISFELHRGEIYGLAGLVGAGRTELAGTLFGLTPADAGQVMIHGQPVTIDNPARAIAHGLAYVPEDRRRHGVIGAMSTVQNVSLASLDQVSRHGLIDRSAEQRLAAPLAARLDLRAPSLETPVGVLSGGNQQKVALARWLATGAQVLLVDEPTQGIDIGAKSEIHGVLDELAAAGAAILLISSELPELLALSDRLGVMCGGRLVAELTRAEADPERILALAMGQTVEATP